jgi:hypothetical protein
MPEAKYWNDTSFADLQAASPSLGSIIFEQQFTATAGQTVFTLTLGTYLPGSNALEVYINGVKQPATAYTETSETTFTMGAAMRVGDYILARVYKFSNNVTAAHAATHLPGGGDSIPLATGSQAGLMSSSDKTSMGKWNGRQYFIQDSPTPTASQSGDEWFLPTTGVLKIWNGTAWIGINTYN